MSAIAIGLLLSILISGALGIYGFCRLAKNQEVGRHLWYGMCALFLVQSAYLTLRGIDFDACPLRDRADIYFFLGWTMNAFYLSLGRSYRMSVLGEVTAPAVLICSVVSSMLFVDASCVANLSGVRMDSTSPWLVWHVALVIIGYGALGLAAISGIVFLIQSRLMKAGKLSGLCRKLPPIRTLQSSAIRLIDIGIIFVIVAQICAVRIGLDIPAVKTVLAMLVNVGYLIVVVVAYTRGLPGRTLAWMSILLYLLSLSIFSVLK